jgi:S-methylmethionine-dependent homocysteine/selenocysteine methylase
VCRRGRGARPARGVGELDDAGQPSRRLPSGENVEAALASVSDLPVDAHLVNCCGANFVADAVRRLRNLTDTPLGGYANSSHVDPLPPGEPPVAPDQVEQVPQTPLDVEGYAAEVAAWIDAGATIVGGCCYTTPAHIARLRRLLDERLA